jgi:hypothetical protein
MKSNLDKLFKTSQTHEDGGVWFQVSPEVQFLVKRFGGFNAPKVKSALAKYFKPYAKQIELGTLSQDKEQEIMFKVFVESCVTDWQGIEIDGQLKPFNTEDCLKLFTQLPDMAQLIIQYASDFNNYREELGN